MHNIREKKNEKFFFFVLYSNQLVNKFSVFFFAFFSHLKQQTTDNCCYTKKKNYETVLHFAKFNTEKKRQKKNYCNFHLFKTTIFFFYKPFLPTAVVVFCKKKIFFVQ